MNHASPVDATAARLHAAVSAPLPYPRMKRLMFPRLRLGRLTRRFSLRRLFDERIYLAPF